MKPYMEAGGIWAGQIDKIERCEETKPAIAIDRNGNGHGVWFMNRGAWYTDNWWIRLLGIGLNTISRHESHDYKRYA